MKAELKFKKTDYNQTPEVETYHTDTIDVSGDDLRKLIQSVLGGYTTQTIVGDWVNECEDESIMSIIDESHTRLFGKTANDYYQDDANANIEVELDNVVIFGKKTVQLYEWWDAHQDSIYNADDIDEKCKKLANKIATKELE